ncbi:MAG: exopolyphosphatase [Geobacter sp.]|nr:exopolyphosphatase [Geobacter sp.]
MRPLKAAIDLGTNTVRLLIGTVDEQGVHPALLKREITRLGGGFRKNSGISREACERTIAALRLFADEIGKREVTRVRAVATSAVRDAANGNEFVAEVLERTGIRLEVIDGEEEGLLTLRSVISGLDEKSGDLMIFDIGGGSTEYTLATDSSPLFTDSLPLGVVRLTEGKRSVEAMSDKIERELVRLQAEIERKGLVQYLRDATLVGTAGTATTLAAIDLRLKTYDYRQVNNHILSREKILAIYEQLLPLSPEERLHVPGLEKGREDLIIAGILLTLKTMEMFGFERMKVSDFGLLEGVLLSIA